jgi:hypothetical protein
VVAALVGAAALAAGQGPEQGGLGGGQRGSQVQGVGEVGVAFGGGPDVDVGGQFP